MVDKIDTSCSENYTTGESFALLIATIIFLPMIIVLVYSIHDGSFKEQFTKKGLKKNLKNYLQFLVIGAVTFLVYLIISHFNDKKNKK